MKRPEIIFLLIALLLGGGLCFLIPPGAGFDEITHLARVWEMSGGALIPNQRLSKGPDLPMAFVEVAYRSRFFNTPVDKDYFARFGAKQIDWNVFTDHKTRSVYFPLSYLPQAFVVGLLGRFLNGPVLWMYYLSRLLELLGYVLLTTLAVRLIPFGKWVLAGLALAPMAMFQAGTISTDPFTNGAAFLYIAWILHLAFQQGPIRWKQIWLTLGVTGLLLAGKPNTVFLLLLMVLLPWNRLPSRIAAALLVGGTALLFAGLVIGWNTLIYSDFYANGPGYGVGGQIGFILSHPLQFAGIFLNDLRVHGLGYLREWVGVYAYNTGRVPDIVYPLYGLVLVGLLATDAPACLIPRKTRVWLLLTFLVGYGFTIASLYLPTNRIGSPFIEGVQGRYFTLVAPLLFLALIPNRPLIRLRAISPSMILAAGSLVVLLIYMGGIYASYYVTCGTSYYTPGLCYQPPYKNWDPNAQFSPPVDGQVNLSQTFTAVCSPVNSIRLWTSKNETQIVQMTTLTVRDATSGAVLADQRVFNASAPDRAWLEVPIPPITRAVGRQFAIELHASESSTSAGALRFGITARREYDGGTFSINGKPQPADMLFQYGCAGK